MWIKENASFKPFYALYCGDTPFDDPFPISNERNRVLITGIRKDKRFVSGDNQISEYYEKNYFLPIPENEPIFEEFKPLLAEKDRLEKATTENKRQIMEVSKKLKLVNLKQFKATL